MKTSPFETLYTECFRGVYRFIFTRVQDMKTAEDITSETFFRAWRRWPPRTITGNAPKAWLYKIARNLLIDHYRARERSSTVPLGETDVSDCTGNPGSERGLDTLAIRMAFTSLSSRDQDVLSLRLAGLSNREIASVLCISEGAAGKACLRALQRLRDKLED